MDKVLGVINLVNESNYLKELTAHRCLASVPFGGRYRLIDYTLSNFIQADITKVAIFAREKLRSLMDHIGSGKEWDLDRQSGGLSIFPPVHANEPIRGDLQQFYDHLEYFEHTFADTVIISPGIHVCKMDFNSIINEHRESGADITVLYKAYDGQAIQKPIYHTCEVDHIGNVIDIDLYTSPKTGDQVILETYIIGKRLLMDLIKRCVENKEYDFLKDAVKANLHLYNVRGIPFKGDLPFIHSIESYFESNLKILDPALAQLMFGENGEVYTKIKHEAPTRYGPLCAVSHSLIANGCVIEGHVENSIIFRGVKIHQGAIVKNSIIMQKGDVEAGAYVENIIADKQVTITKDRTVVGQGTPRVLKKMETI
ncbi:MAG TPA: glucose-1-phosphate adenylyltransferase subunit GlgD [Sporolactobacillaceae bacterium]|nr:glucose-1-phosphate adenylyltransferase subunit GlgD [Sporolactobacillaceae bacterium]